MGLLHFQLISYIGFYLLFFDGFLGWGEDVYKLDIFSLFMFLGSYKDISRSGRPSCVALSCVGAN